MRASVSSLLLQPCRSFAPARPELRACAVPAVQAHTMRCGGKDWPILQMYACAMCGSAAQSMAVCSCQQFRQPSTTVTMMSAGGSACGCYGRLVDRSIFCNIRQSFFPVSRTPLAKSLRCAPNRSDRKSSCKEDASPLSPRQSSWKLQMH